MEVNKADTCSVVFINCSAGWYPVDLVEGVTDNAPEPIRTICAMLLRASKIAEDFGIYCVFSVDIPNRELRLNQLVVPAEKEEEQEPVEIPSTIASAILIGLSLFLGKEAIPMFKGEYSILHIDGAPEDKMYVKHLTDKEVGELRDTSICVYSYDDSFRFVGSYDPVNKQFIDKNGEKIEEDGEVIRCVGEIFDVRNFCEGQDSGEVKE